MDFTPERISQSAAIRLDGPVEKVFPLFGPIREMEWADGWEPEIIYAKSPLVEEHMIFKTKGRYDSEPHYQWIVTQYDPVIHRVEYTVSTANRVWFIRVECVAKENGTIATVTYTYTGLNPEGNRLNRESLQRMYAHNLQDWEEAINYYLKNGEKLISR